MSFVVRRSSFVVCRSSFVEGKGRQRYLLLIRPLIALEKSQKDEYNKDVIKSKGENAYLNTIDIFVKQVIR